MTDKEIEERGEGDAEKERRERKKKQFNISYVKNIIVKLKIKKSNLCQMICL